MIGGLVDFKLEPGKDTRQNNDDNAAIPDNLCSYPPKQLRHFPKLHVFR